MCLSSLTSRRFRCFFFQIYREFWGVWLIKGDVKLLNLSCLRHFGENRLNSLPSAKSLKTHEKKLFFNNSTSNKQFYRHCTYALSNIIHQLVEESYESLTATKFESICKWNAHYLIKTFNFMQITCLINWFEN